MSRRALLGSGVAAAVLALVTTAAAAPVVGQLALASGDSPFATCAVGGPGTSYPNAEVEPFVAVNPKDRNNIIGVYQQDRWSNGGAHGLVTAYSFDGGAKFGHSFPPLSNCAGGTPANGGDYPRSSDPWVSIGPDGRAYQVSISFTADEVTSAVLASTSSDGGQTWSNPATIEKDVSSVPGVNFNDKESVTADPHLRGTAYVVWDRAQFPSDSASLTALQHSFAFRGAPYFSKTTDGGKTWSPARQISDQNIFSIGNQIVVEPDGTLIDVFHFGKGSGRDDPNASLQGVMRSTDAGDHWSPPIVISNNPVTNDVDPNTGFPLRTGADVGGGIPDIGVDPGTGKLYVVWEDSRFSGTHNDIAMSTSADEGKTWSTPVKVNQTPVPVLAFTPAVDVLSNGTVAVTYYDFRNNDPHHPSTLLTDYFVAESKDGGSTFSEARITPTSFDDTNAPISRGYFLGDYQGLANDGKNFKVLFVQTNSGKPTNRTDVFATTVAP
jgi:BNR repeat-like domain